MLTPQSWGHGWCFWRSWSVGVICSLFGLNQERVFVPSVASLALGVQVWWATSNLVKTVFFEGTSMIQCVPWSNCAGWAFKSTANVFARTKRGCSCKNKSHLVFLLPSLFAFMKASVVHQRYEKPRPRSMAYVSGVGFQPPSTCEEWSWSPALEMAGEDSDSRLLVLLRHLTWRNSRFDEMFAMRAQGTSQ